MTALRARRTLSTQGIIDHEREIDIINSPYVSGVPDGLAHMQYLKGTMMESSFVIYVSVSVSVRKALVLIYSNNTLSSTIMGLK